MVVVASASHCSDAERRQHAAGDSGAAVRESKPAAEPAMEPPRAAAPSAPAKPIPQVAPPAAPVARERAASLRRPNDLTGRWKVFARTNEWTVTLAPATGMAGEYAGEGVRDTPGDAGVPVQLKVGALLSNGRLKLWLGPGVVVCDAPFSARRPMTGRCRVALGEGDPGPFRAERLPDQP